MNGKYGAINLGNKLKILRQARKLSLAAVAKPAKISVTYLQKLEAGVVKNPSPRVLHRLSDVLDVPYAKLMELIGYLLPDPKQIGKTSQSSLLRETLIKEDLSEDEQRAVAVFVRYLKEQRNKS